MQPWQVSFGITAALIPLLGYLLSRKLAYFDGYWTTLWGLYAYHLGVTLLMVVLLTYLLLYRVVRSLSLGDVGSRVALLEKSVRQGGVDSELSDALQREDTGEYNS